VIIIKISLIAAIDNNNAIGKDNQLLFKIKEDLERFKKITTNNVVIMGRKTRDSLPKKFLPNRSNIIISKNEKASRIVNSDSNSIIEIYNDIETVIKKFENYEKELFIIGGASIYEQFLPYANKIYITKIYSEVNGADKFFPKIDSNFEIESESELFENNEGIKYKFIDLVKKEKNKMNKADWYFKTNLDEILTSGNSTKGHNVRPRWKDGTQAHTLYINQVVEKYDISKGEFPISTYRPVAWKSAIKEVLWIYQDQSNDLELLQNKHKIFWWNDWNVGDNTIGQRYGATVKKYKLIDKLLDGLKNEPYTRRHIINLYQYSDFEETDGLYPCAFETIWSVRGEYLDMTLHQRSNDYLVAGTINKIQYVALMMMVARHCGLKCGVFMHIVENLHIYDRHINQAQELFNRKSSRTEPKLILKEGKNNFYDFTIDDFELVDFNCDYNQLKFELAI